MYDDVCIQLPSPPIHVSKRPSQPWMKVLRGVLSFSMDKGQPDAGSNRERERKSRKDGQGSDTRRKEKYQPEPRKRDLSCQDT